LPHIFICIFLLVRWVNLDGRTPPVSLILSAVKFASNPDKNLLPEPVIVAQVLATPTVAPDSDVIYTTATNELRINGTGFVGAKKVDIYFDPPLYVGVGYEVVSKFPLSNEQIVLRLRHGYKWRDEPGPLSVIGVDTGGGPVKTDGEDGVRVAEVQADLDLHGVTVETTADQQLIYWDEPNIMITGTGFNAAGNTLRWANGILGKGVNYTTTSTSETSISLRIMPGSHWRTNQRGQGKRCSHCVRAPCRLLGQHQAIPHPLSRAPPQRCRFPQGYLQASDQIRSAAYPRY
jgi:hypothetical protein